jgi:hypothetical protein
VSNDWVTAASWAQAFGTILAVLGSAWLAASDGRATRRREEQTRIAAKTAALNLALMAHSQIRNLHNLLRDEALRGRLNHISPSRGFLASQQMMTTFPIHTLEDPDAMVAFSYFPSSLAIAAEIYGHLEEAVRAAEDENPAEVFDHYAAQMVMIEEHLDARLRDLKAALMLPDGVGAGHGAEPLRAERHVSRKARGARQAETAKA